MKDTDRHQYLHYTSAHFYHTKRSVVLAKLFALVICVHLKKTLRDTWLEWNNGLLKKDYWQDLINSEMNEVKFPDVENKFNNNKEKGTIYVVTFHPLLKSLGSTLNKNYLLWMNDEVKKVFSLRPMVSFRSARKLSSYLVQAKLYPVERKLVHTNVIVIGVRCVKAFLKQIHLHVVIMVLLIKQINLIVMKNA